MRAARAVAKGLDLHARKINTLALAPGGGGGALLASASTDCTIKARRAARGARAGARHFGEGGAWACGGRGFTSSPGPLQGPRLVPPPAHPPPLHQPQVWDARRLAGGGGRKPVPLSVCTHAKSSQGAAWAPDGSGRLLSVAFDDTLRVWAAPDGSRAAAGAGMEQRLSVKHDNYTGRCVCARAHGACACLCLRLPARVPRCAARLRPPPKPAPVRTLTNLPPPSPQPAAGGCCPSAPPGLGMTRCWWAT